jgi:polyhydroxybutyrate depolymerase
MGRAAWTMAVFCGSLVFVGCDCDGDELGHGENLRSGEPSDLGLRGDVSDVGADWREVGLSDAGQNDPIEANDAGTDTVVDDDSSFRDAWEPSDLGGVIGGDRPVSVHVPPGYDPAVPAPLLILLHGYSATGDLQEFYLDLSAEADARGYLYATPSGTKDSLGFNYWNATAACCDIDDSGVDDVAYLRSLLDDIEAIFNVDRKRVYFAGHSNGGFMAHRMACEYADKIAAIASLAGSTHADESDCQPTSPVATLNIHGTFDAIIRHRGGEILGDAYPSAEETTARWATYNNCDDVPDDSAAAMDLIPLILGDETEVRRYANDCDDGTSAELWSLRGVGHLPGFNGDFRVQVFDFFDAHPKP